MAEGDNWGYLSPLEGYGRVGDYASDYIAIPYETAVSEQKNYMQAAHAMLYAFQDNVLWDMFNTRAAILMQMRFDGLIGFPGGLVDEPGESPMQGLNRELEEEIGLDSAQYTFTHNHHINTVVHHQKKLCLHFFAMEVKMDEFIQIEKESISAPEYGVEVFGVLRPPLYTMADGVRGLPAFLTNRFAGNAREQFLLSLTKCNILTETEVEDFGLSTLVDDVCSTPFDETLYEWLLRQPVPPMKMEHDTSSPRRYRDLTIFILVPGPDLTARFQNDWFDNPCSPE